MTDEEEKRALLASSRLFSGFSAAVIDAIVPLLSPCAFEANSIICLKGDESDYLYIVREGEVEVTVSSAEGKVILLGTMSAGDAFGEVGLIDKGPRTANVSTRGAVTLYRLSAQSFDKVSALFGMDEFMAINAYVCLLFRGVTNNLEETAFLDASDRVARKIQSLYQQRSGEIDGNRFSIKISQERLGRMAGISREAANIALNQLEERGLIESKYKCIVIPDIGKFQDALADL